MTTTNTEELLRRTYAALKKTESRVAELERARTEPLAVVGMACRFPGGANDPEALWRFLAAGGNACVPVPPERWDASRFYDPSPDTPGTTHAARAHFLSEPVDGFDAPFFGISGKEAVSLDPQQRLLLEVSWEALEEAAIDPHSLRGSNTGVYVGISADDYTQAHRHSGRLERIDGYALTGTCFAPAAGRISYTFGFEGPAIAIDTACSSSLVAVHLASQALRNGECDLALAAGVNLILSPIFHISSSKLGTISPDGQCKTFDASANGYGRGEGCGVVVLKRLSDALAANDRILALVRGSAVNQDGRSNGLTAPNGLAQENVIQRALASAKLTPADVGYIEVHGTGTPLGDPIELEAIGRVMRDARAQDDPLIVGTIKTNIGHLEAGAGVAGLIKAIQCLRHEGIPPHLHLREPSPHIPWERLPLVVPRELTPWPRTSKPRRAGVSSFGFSGTNAHVVLEEAPLQPATSRSARPLHVLPLSARSAEALDDLARRTAEHLLGRDEASLADIAHTLATGRAHFAHRVAVVAATRDEAAKLLGESTPSKRVARGSGAASRPKIAFLYTGQGSQYAGMGRTLYDSQPVFRAALDECAALFPPLLDAIHRGTDEQLQQTELTQPAIFSIEYALTKLWASWGIEPDVVCGHSIGEYAAACAAGVLTLADAMTLVAARGRLMQALPAGGAMIAVSAGEESVAPLLDGDVSIAAVNARGECVVSGDGAAVARIAELLRARGIASQPLRVSHAFHSPLMRPMIGSFSEVASMARYAAARIPIVSTVTGRRTTPSELANAGYWTRQIEATVRFAAAAETLATDGATIFLELGAAPILTNLAARSLRDSSRDESRAFLPSLARGEDDWSRILVTLASLYAHGAEIDWRGFDAPWPRTKQSLPKYPFQRKSYYLQPLADSGVAPAAVDGPTHPYLGRRIESPRLAAGSSLHEALFTPEHPPFLKEHQIFGRIISPAAAHVSMALAAAKAGGAGGVLEDVAFTAPLVVDEGERRAVQLIVDRDGAHARFELVSRNTGDSRWVAHCSGAIAALHLVPPPSPTSLDDVAARCSETMSHDDFYALIERAGYSTGPNFQCVRSIRKGADEALCVVESHARFDDDAIHPGLIDSLLQTVLPACERSASSMLDGESVLIPLHMAAVRVHRPLAGALTVHTRVSVAAGHVKSAIRAYDTSGALALEIEDFLLKQTDKATLYRELRSDDRSLLYTIQWSELAASSASLDANAVIFRGDAAQLIDVVRTLAAPQKLYIVTERAQPVLADDVVDPMQATLWGLGRAIARELPDLFGGIIDTDDRTAALPAGEEQLAIRKGRLYAPRLVAAPRPKPQRALPDSYFLDVGARHTLDDLTFKPRPRVAPAANEVEVEIHASGLNFRDVLNALGQYPGDAGLMGFECVGVVARTGSEVTHVRPGDAVIVMAAPGCIGSHITADARFVMPKPPSMSFAEAVTLPATFLTAYYALHVLGNIGRHDRILIHAAAGGVGLAAVQLAQAAGAEIYATAGSPEKRDHLRALGVEHVFSSRTPEFAKAILERTAGRGVTMVLNSLTGEFIPESFRALTSEGRFLEMGKIGIWSEERVAAVDSSIVYLPFDLAAVSRDNPAVILQMWEALLALFASGALRPLPVTVFSMREAEEAFRYMAQARHIGKIVLSREDELRREARRQFGLVRAEATYLITGGLGALGLVTAQWLADEGAHTIVLLGRNVRECAEVEALRQQKVNVLTIACDVANRDDVERVLDSIRTTLPPLRGIIHAAGVLDDAMLGEQSAERFARVFEPKARGASNLHEATRGDALDFFVLYSSIAAIIGNLGQSNYAAANAYLDALAALRRRNGLPATSINWGPWADAGMAASLSNERFSAQGIRFLKAADALRTLKLALEEELTQACIADVDWSAYARAHDLDPSRGLFAAVGGAAEAKVAATQSKRDLVAELRGALAVERRQLLTSFLADLAREVLGYGESDVITPDRPLTEQGFDSLMTVDMRNRLGKHLGAPLPASLLFDHPTLERLADYLLRDVIALEETPAATGDSADALLQEIDDLVNS
ncbi:MAG TPA: type I polyketide synthase [Thermoanaerobaculia bacterium]|jgi:acyl transferase domain-containing protein/NADPH:quinone reductase-like Zn-dependent oxidoreductase/NAD(P)-dependent dehydrogenase (short-subunit alcohol dehydrogenase family)/acyl carrier protein